ncbi:MAG: enoyl-CoA hydratase/isomerase family protein [Acetobacteraceae bacterium]|nr:enoyl-CoA hydratase/isomerase family protein [Acetobacteraceae bacterium]
MYEQTLYDAGADQGGIATITLNRPERLNAWTPVMEREVRDAMQRASADDAVRAVILTGAGRGFCAGADLGQRKPGEPYPEWPEGGIGDEADPNFTGRYTDLAGVPKPVVAAINGAVAGVGLAITLFADVRFMAAGAKLSAAFARRGLIAEHATAWTLPRLIGPMNAMDLLLSGRTILAEEAAAMGLVRVLPAEGFLDAARAATLGLIGLSSPRSMRVIKRQVWDGFFQDLATASARATEAQAASRESADYREGITAFLEKRTPRFAAAQSERTPNFTAAQSERGSGPRSA